METPRTKGRRRLRRMARAFVIMMITLVNIGAGVVTILAYVSSHHIF